MINLKKRGSGLMTSVVMFIVLNISFLAIMFLAVSVASTNYPLYEETYAKQIGLLIDSAKPGTTIKLDITELYIISSKNKMMPVVQLDCQASEVLVKVTNTKGYRYRYFTNLKDCVYSINAQKRTFTVKI